MGRLVFCTECHKLLDESKFRPSWIRQSKQKGLRGSCRECRRKHRLTKWTGLREIKIPVKKLREGKCPWNKSVCTHLKVHHETMKNDPNRLTTEFMKDLLGGPRCKELIS